MKENKKEEMNISTPFELTGEGYEPIGRDLVRNSLIELSEKNVKLDEKEIRLIIKSLENYTMAVDEDRSIRFKNVVARKVPYTVSNFSDAGANFPKLDSAAKSRMFFIKVLEKLTNKSVERFRKSLEKEQALTHI